MHTKHGLVVLVLGVVGSVESTRFSRFDSVEHFSQHKRYRRNSTGSSGEPGLVHASWYLESGEGGFTPGQKFWNYPIDWMWLFSDFSWSLGGQVGLLIPDNQTDEEPLDYTTACSNASSIFQSPLVFTNCLSLAVTTTSVQDGEMEFDEESVQDTEPVFHFGNLSTFPGLATVETIASCLWASCQDTDITNCTMASHGNFSKALDTSLNTTTRIRALYDGGKDYCPQGSAEPSSDLVGPGVLISYFAQCTIVVLFFISKIDHAIRGLLYLKRRYWRATATIGRPSVDSEPKAKQIRKAIARHTTAVASVAVDFQEAQIFFVLTIQIAALWFYDEAGRIRNSNSLAQSDAVWFAVPVAGYGIIPVLLGQALLQRSRRHWWYTFILMTVSSVVTWYCFAQPEQSDYAALWAHLRKTRPIAECGGNPSPATSCWSIAFANINDPYLNVILESNSAFGVPLADSPQLRAFKNYRRLQHLGIEAIAKKTFIWATIFLFADQTYTWARQYGIIGVGYHSSGSGLFIVGVKEGAENRLGQSFEVHAKDQNRPKTAESSTMNTPLIPQEAKYASIPNLNDDVQSPWDYQHEKGLAFETIDDDQSADLGYSPRRPEI
ncbi:hypothetical protein GGR57DRAFT_503192 [Xylariaceae sp. FL1272]|nr:hypothetical protein GGR57DRAFT_503192 [Xylariaceae sp. FL1272]